MNKREYQKRYYKKNKEKINNATKKWHENHKEELTKYWKKYYLQHKNEMRKSRRLWKERNKEKVKKDKKEWINNNREHVKEYSRKYGKEWRKNPRKRIDANISSLICRALKGKKAGQKWQDLVGYTLQELIEHLEKQFDDKMFWDNYGNYWWIDHIKPRSLFNYTTPEEQEFRDCWCLTNLQPLEKMANIKKSNHF